MNRILNWWNNTKLVKNKKNQWLQERQFENPISNELNWPENVTRDNKEDFRESDWIYNSGNRCERFVTWIFHTFTRRCTVLDRNPKYNNGEIPGFETHKPFWITAYRVKEDYGDTIVEYVEQSDLSF